MDTDDLELEDDDDFDPICRLCGVDLTSDEELCRECRQVVPLTLQHALKYDDKPQLVHRLGLRSGLVLDFHHVSFHGHGADDCWAELEEVTNVQTNTKFPRVVGVRFSEIEWTTIVTPFNPEEMEEVRQEASAE